MDMTNYTQALDSASILLMQSLMGKISKLVDDYQFDQNIDVLYGLTKRTQQLAMESRLLYGRVKSESSKDSDRAVLREMGYCCERIGAGVRIELPLLLPKRGGDASFITGPLHELLSLEDKTERFQDCTVIFQHIYGDDKRTADIRDHDNTESRAVLNVIERYLLTSDNGYYCTNVQTTEFGRSSKTVITILPGKVDFNILREAVRT